MRRWYSRHGGPHRDDLVVSSGKSDRSRSRDRYLSRVERIRGVLARNRSVYGRIDPSAMCYEDVTEPIQSGSAS